MAMVMPFYSRHH